MRDHPSASVSASWSFWGKSLDKALLLPRGGGTAHHWPGKRTAWWPEQEGVVWEGFRRSGEWLGEGFHRHSAQRPGLPYVIFSAGDSEGESLIFIDLGAPPPFPS